jgi:membrane carboxypeptidase/penicillin-binding protein
LSVALGTYEMSPLEFANLWRIFLNSGKNLDEIYNILSENRNRLLSFGIENNLDVR